MPTSSCILSISRRGREILLRRSRIPLSFSPSPSQSQRRHPALLSVAQSWPNKGRINTRCVYSSVSAVDDDGHVEKIIGASDGDVDALETARLPGIHTEERGTDADNLNLPDAMESSLFGPTSVETLESQKYSSDISANYSQSAFGVGDFETEPPNEVLEASSETSIMKPQYSFDRSSKNSVNLANRSEEATSKPSLSELLRTDIFTKSWSEPDRIGSVAPGRRTEYRGINDCFADPHKEPASVSIPSSSQCSPSSFSDFDDTPASWNGYSSETNSQPQQSSAVETKYKIIRDQTDELLDRLSREEDSSTLQLMDFDEVMTEWSRFHSVIDIGKHDESRGGYASEHDTLKPKSFEQCKQLLDALEHNYDCILHHMLPASMTTDESLPQSKHLQLMPNAVSYNLALHTLAHSEKGEHAAQEAFSILLRMLDRCQRYLKLLKIKDDQMPTMKLPPPPFEPTIITFNSVLHAIAKSGANDAGHLAEEVFAKIDHWNDQCEESKSRNERGAAHSGDVQQDADSAIPLQFSSHARPCVYRGVVPNARTLACVIDAWANSKTTQQQSYSPERAEAILDVAIKRRRTYIESVIGEGIGIQGNSIDLSNWEAVRSPSMDSFEGREESVQEDLTSTEYFSTSLQNQMESSSEQPEAIKTMPSLRPNIVAFNTCIQAWAASASSRGREGALRAQELLSRLETLAERSELNLPSDHPNFFFDDDGSPDAESSLKPNARSYSVVMNAWANVATFESNTGDTAASHCEDILNKMEARGEVDASIRPNLVAYVTSISAWARTKGVEHAASRAENILNNMVDLYYNEADMELPSLDGDVENASHDAPFNSVITAYARSSDVYAPERALAVLQRLEASAISPTVTSYNAAMDCCAKHGKPERALEIFNRMKEKGITKDYTSYDTVLNAFAKEGKEGSAERAHEFLCQLEKDQLSGESNFTPSSLSYATVINAFAQASGKEYGGIHTVKRAKEIYEKLINHLKEGTIYGNPDPFANSCFLNACANVNGTGLEKKEALVMAITAFEDAKKQSSLHGEPNHYTFGTMMKACARLSSDDAEKQRLMENIFVQACQRGLVSRAVFGQLLRHTPPHINMKIILGLGGTKRNIPESWHCNLPEKHWPAPPWNNNNNN